MRVSFSTNAERWLYARIAEIARDRPNAARRILHKLERQIGLLSSFPKIKERGLIPETRKISLKPFIFTARLRNGELQIVAARFATQKDALTPDEAWEPDDDTSLENDNKQDP